MIRELALSLVSILAVSWLGLAVLADEGSSSLPLGATAPKADVRMKNVDGRELSIQDVKGPKGTLVIFTCNHCPWAKAWEQRIVDLGNAWSKKGFGVIAVNPNDPKAYPDDSFDEMQRRAKATGMTFPYVVDSTSGIARAFGATRTPEVFLFDAEGKLVYKGAVDDNAKEPEKVQHRYLADALEAVAASRQPPLAETKALGCSIKFRAQA